MGQFTRPDSNPVRRA